MAAPLLSYSVEVTRKRWRRRALWVGVLVLLGFVGYLGRNVPARMAMLERQAECMKYQRAAGPTKTYFAEDVPKGIEGDRDYHIGQGKDGKYFWYFYPKCLAELEALVPAIAPNPKHTPVYVGERVSDGGSRRLVVVRYDQNAGRFRSAFPWMTMEPGTVLGPDTKPAVMTNPWTSWTDSPPWEPRGVLNSLRSAGECEVGQSDPNDRSHFTANVLVNGKRYQLNGWLCDDGEIMFAVSAK